MIVQDQIKVIVWDCLNNYDYDNAIFLAERLHAEVTSEETKFLLATCYYRAGRVKEAYHLLKNIKNLTLPQSRILLARCAIEQKLYRDAEVALGGSIDDVFTNFGEQAAFALQLSAKIYSATDRRTKAADALKKALSLNPFLWKSYAQLCNMGEKLDPQQVFHSNNTDFSFEVSNLVNHVSNSENISIVNGNIPNNTNLNAIVTPINAISKTPTPMSTSITPDTQAPVKRMHSVFSGVAPIPFSPSFGMLPMDDSPVYTQTLTDSNEQKAIPKIVNSLRTQMGQLKDVFSPSPRCTLGPAPRRSSRLFSNNNSSYSVKENNKSPSKKFVAPKSPSRKTKQRTGKNIKPNTIESNERKSIEIVTPTITPKICTGVAFLHLLKDFGEAYKALAFLECKRAINLFEQLSSKQLSSPWVQTMIARAYYEMTQYEAAAKIFSEIRKLHPNRTEGMDIYSTCLWHLQQEAQLSALAQELVELDRSDSIAWLAAGNCFSLHKERDTALKFFKRAVQINPEGSYGHTLLGHEYAVAEEAEKALVSFRTAVGIDPRNYVAWYGIATVFARQERWRGSEIHIRRALAIHPHSGVLRCQLGLAQAALGKINRALITLERAVDTDTNNPLSRFHRASVLLRAGRPQEALEDLQHLKDIAPRESLVYYLLGKVHNKLGNSHLALMHFSWASDLDPKRTGGHIKDGFDPSRQEDPPENAS